MTAPFGNVGAAETTSGSAAAATPIPNAPSTSRRVHPVNSVSRPIALTPSKRPRSRPSRSIAKNQGRFVGTYHAVMKTLLVDLARHQSWADAEHWRALEAYRPAIEERDCIICIRFN